MNKVILMGRLTRDPEIRWSQSDSSQERMCIARYTLAVDKRTKEGGTDFITIAVFGRGAEFTEKYLKKGTKIVVTGRIQTGSYTNKDGVKIYTTEVVAEDQEFAESKGSEGQQGNRQATQEAAGSNGLMNIPEGIEEELPFN